MTLNISSSASFLKETFACLTGSSSAFIVSFFDNAPTSGKLNSRSAYDFESPANLGRIGNPLRSGVSF